METLFEGIPIEQGLTTVAHGLNPPGFINLLKHKNTHWFMCYLCCLHTKRAESSSCDGDYVVKS